MTRHLATNFLQRIRQRKLVQWTAAYAAVAAALFGTLDIVAQVFAWPGGLLRACFFLLLAGLFATVVLAWFHGEQGRQRVGTVEALLLCSAALFGFTGAAHSVLGGAGGDASATEGVLHLVVLPFADASVAGDQQYLGEGIAEEVRHALSRLQGVHVARGSAGSSIDAPDLTSDPGRRGITHVLGGSVQRVGNAVRVTARLTDATGAEAWSDSYNVPAAELFAVEDRIAAAVARQLRPRQASDSAMNASRPATRHPVAHDHYLRGEYALKQRSPASVVQAIAEYRAASALDPELTAAVAREAYAYGLFLDWGWVYPGLPADQLLRRGLDLSSRAVAQDSLSSEAWLARAYLLQVSDPELLRGASEAYGRAVALDPTNPEAQHQYGQALTALGRYAEAKAAYHAALAVEADRPLTLVPLSAIALREGDMRAAERWADSAVALASEAPYPWASRAQLRLALGDAPGARADAEQALRIDPSYELPAQSALAAALAVLGERPLAEQALDRARRALVQPSTPSNTEAYYLAAALLRMDRRSEAVDIVEATLPRGSWLWFYFESPTFDELRSDARFRRIMQSADPNRRRD